MDDDAARPHLSRRQMGRRPMPGTSKTFGSLRLGDFPGKLSVPGAMTLTSIWPKYGGSR